MPSLSELAEALRREFEANPRIAAAGVFGSVSVRDTWERSDIDLFVITDEEGDRWEGIYLRRDGVRVHLQTLSRAVLRRNAAINNGGPFFAALAGVAVWFDRSGDLLSAVSAAQALTAAVARARACGEFCLGVDALHLAEKYARKSKFADARVSLTVALGRLAAAALIEAGVYPPRDIWSASTAAGLPEAGELRLALAGLPGDLPRLIDGIWRRLRPALRRYASPIVDVISREGPLSYNDLDDGKRLPRIQLSERLLDELVAQGLLLEMERSHDGLGLNETCYASPTR